MKKLLFILLSILMVACATATVDVPVCADHEVGTVPASPITGVTIPPISFQVPLDLSDSLKKVDDVSKEVSVVINQLLLTSDTDLQWITQVDVSITGDTIDTHTAPLATYKSDGSDPGKSLPLTVIMSGDLVINYLRIPSTLTFTVSGMAQTHPVTLSNTLCVQATGSVSKSL